MTAPPPHGHVCYVVVADGWDRHARMAWISASSVRICEPSARITMIVDARSPGARAAAVRLEEVADDVRLGDAPFERAVARNRYLKITLRHQVRGDVLYLDSDTIAIGPFLDLLDDAADVAAATDFNHRPETHWFPPNLEGQYRALGWKYPLSQYLNGGVIWQRDTSGAHRFAEEWLSRWAMQVDRIGTLTDQASLNSALDASGVRWSILPGSLNAMVVKRNFDHRRARILHFFGTEVEQRGTLLEHLLAVLERDGVFDRRAYERAVRQQHYWGPRAEPWQFWKTRNYVRAVERKVTRILRIGT
jgi:hypothetical protein